VRAAIGWMCVLCAAVDGYAQQDTPAAREAIEPDRPDVTNGTHIVDIGLLQIEIGGVYTHVALGQHAFGTPVTARVGLLEWFEARVGTDGLLLQTDQNGRNTGLGNIQLGAKLRLWADPGGVPVLSVLPAINLPTASAEHGLGSGDADYTVAFLTGTDIGRHWHVDVNYGIGSIGAGGGQPHFVTTPRVRIGERGCVRQLESVHRSLPVLPPGGRCRRLDGSGRGRNLRARRAIRD